MILLWNRTSSSSWIKGKIRTNKRTDLVPPVLLFLHRGMSMPDAFGWESFVDAD